MDVEGGVEPVRAPLPDVARDVVESKAVGQKRVHRGRAQVTVLQGVVRRERALPDVAVPLAIGLQLIAPGVALLLKPAAGRSTTARATSGKSLTGLERSYSPPEADPLKPTYALPSASPRDLRHSPAPYYRTGDIGALPCACSTSKPSAFGRARNSGRVALFAFGNNISSPGAGHRRRSSPPEPNRRPRLSSRSYWPGRTDPR
jgi:hypothetical protein